MAQDNSFLRAATERLEDNLLQFVASRQSEILTVTFATADTDVEVIHNLDVANPTRVRYQLLQAPAPVFIYHNPASEWGAHFILLRATADNITVKLLLTVDEAPEGVEELSKPLPLKLKLVGGSTENAIPPPEASVEISPGITPRGELVDLTDAGPGISMEHEDDADQKWSILVPNSSDWPALHIIDEGAIGGTPLLIRYNEDDGIYEIMPGVSTGGTIGVHLGSNADGGGPTINSKFENLYLFGDVFAQDRDVAEGKWQTRAFAAGNYTASGTMTWTVDTTARLFERWTIIGDTLRYKTYISWFSGTSTLGGAASTELRIASPVALLAANDGLTFNAVVVGIDGGVATDFLVGQSGSGTYIAISRKAGGNFTVGGATAGCIITAEFEIA